jgi:hypothetical protein
MRNQRLPQYVWTMEELWRMTRDRAAARRLFSNAQLEILHEGSPSCDSSKSTAGPSMQLCERVPIMRVPVEVRAGSGGDP